ncbi:MAG: hypothetical protein HN348_19340 [Proteobacteria bacterium]|nr:hypothetical protein [Pseudomonadota bacterium]
MPKYSKVKDVAVNKVEWAGTLTAVQPRIRLTRSFDQRSHTYQGYILRVNGTIGDAWREFVVATGEAAQAKERFVVGDRICGKGVPVRDPRLETAELYKVSGLKRLSAAEPSTTAPPWHEMPPTLPEYRERGHRRLAARTFDTKCSSCQWGCRMAVEMIIDHWNPSQRRYRTETFCYGPLSCPLYSPGPKRKVPGRRGMQYVEEDWVDEDATGHRDLDE